MSINYYKESLRTKPISAFVQQTSKDSYKDIIGSGELNTQCSRLIKVYSNHEDGLTDVQASKLLNVDASTLSARRNDITKKHGSHVIIKKGVRDNGKGRRNGIVWGLNPYFIQ